MATLKRKFPKGETMQDGTGMPQQTESPSWTQPATVSFESSKAAPKSTESSLCDERRPLNKHRKIADAKKAANRLKSPHFQTRRKESRQTKEESATFFERTRDEGSKSAREKQRFLGSDAGDSPIKDNKEKETRFVGWEEGNVAWQDKRDHNLGCQNCWTSLFGQQYYGQDWEIAYRVADLGENLLLGSCCSPFCPYNLQRLGVVSVLRVMNEDPRFPRPPKYIGFKYLTLDIGDCSLPEEGKKLESELPRAFEFISQGTKNGKVYVHCVAGISRSPTVCLAYLMNVRGLSLEQAREQMKKVRPMIEPNAEFEKVLRNFTNTSKRREPRPIRIVTGSRSSVGQ